MRKKESIKIGKKKRKQYKNNKLKSMLIVT